MEVMTIETIGITAIVGILTYTVGVFFKPLLLVARDATMWLIIDRKIDNNETRDMIQTYAHNKRENQCRQVIIAVSHQHDEDVIFKFPHSMKLWEPIVFSSESLEEIKSLYKTHSNILQTMEININRKAMAYDLLIKHNSLDDNDFNPIRKKLSDELAEYRPYEINDYRLYEEIEAMLAIYIDGDSHAWRTNRMRQRAHTENSENIERMQREAYRRESSEEPVE